MIMSNESLTPFGESDSVCRLPFVSDDTKNDRGRVTQKGDHAKFLEEAAGPALAVPA